jgi:hypothetical protein
VQKSFAFGAVSRNKFYELKKAKYPVPSCGAYNVNYASIERKYSPINWTQKKNEPKVIKEKVEPPLRLIELQKESHSIMDFSKMNPKLTMPEMQATSPNEKRFEKFNYTPSVSSKAR